VKLRTASIIAIALLAGCTRKGNLEDGGIYTVRSNCPQVAIPAATGDITLFDPMGSTDASAMDIEAAMTDVRANCQDSGSEVISTATFSVVATRRDASQARQVLLPFFDVVVQAGNKVVAKRLGSVALDFPAGSYREATGPRRPRRQRRESRAPQQAFRKMSKQC
jgi:hypothetical protein